MTALSDDQLAFVVDRHLATLTTLRADGTPHVVPVAFTWDPARGRARNTTKATSVKARNIARATAQGVPARAALCQLEGWRWLTLEGVATVSHDAEDVAEAVAAYAERYRQLEFDPARVVVHLDVDRVMGSVR